ncbi:MAG: hypothetical protein FIA91_04800, partial [Geobacter sp.]|nr:hypothetical protein [Geobacter sp.]
MLVNSLQSLAKRVNVNRWLLPINSALIILIIAALALITADFASFRIARLFPRKIAQNTQPQAPAQLSDDLMAAAPILSKGLFGKATQGTLTPVVAKQAEKAQAPALNITDLILLGTVQ